VALAVVCVAGAAATFAVALHTGAGFHVDHALYRRASGFSAYPVRLAGQNALRTIDVGSVAVALVVLLAIGVARGRYARALVAVALVVVSVGSVEALKHGLPHVQHAVPAGRRPTWPSGHTSIAVSLGLALVLAAPPLLRPVAALAGAAYAAGIGLSVVVLGWHYPSDVAGSFFVCGAWGCLAAAALRAAARRPAVDVRGLVLALVGVAVALVAAAALAGAHPGAVEAARSSRSVVAVAVAVGFLSVALFAAFTPLVGEERS
jgi:membrane-associated phospholipid phosphatase